jgi:biopolymer transport protein TolQ
MEGGLDIFQILLESGLVVKAVLLILIVCSVYSWAIILEKKKSFSSTNENNAEFKEFFDESANLADIYEKAKEYDDSTMSSMFKSGYLELVTIKEKLKLSGKESEFKSYIKEHGIQALERSLKQGANNSNTLLEVRLTSLASIGSISPFIGLFGTVWGIIDSFAAMSSGGGSIEAVAPGIAEALVATAVGLAAAIPAVWAYNFFSSKIGSLNSEMENFGQEFLNLIERSILISKE